MTRRNLARSGAALRAVRAEPESITRRVAVYTRRSTDEEHQPYSIEAQTLRLDAYIASQPGWVKTATFTDNASAKDTHRPGLRAALAAAKSGRIDILLVLKVDRFSRRQRDLVSLVEQLTSLNVAFVSATEAFDTSTPAGRAMLQMLGTFAEFEREMIIDRVIAGMERHAAAGRWPGGVRPDGYHLDPTTKRLVVDEERAVLVREIFDLYTRKRLGTAAIATELNRRGLGTRTGRPWSPHTIRWLLTNPAYLGQVTFRDTVVQHAHPAIIDQVTFATAEQLLTARGEARSQRAASNSDYHLTGRIRCPHCHKGFIGTAAHGRTKTYRYYTCWTRARYGPTTCNADRINADAADQALFANLADFYRHHRHLIAEAASEADTARHAAADRHRSELTAVEKEITRTATAADRYLTAFEDNTLDPALLQDRLIALRARTAHLHARRDELTDLLDQTPTMPTNHDLDALADHIDRIIDHGTTAMRKALIEQLIEEIQILGPGQIRPIYRVPRLAKGTEPAAEDGTTVRPMGNLVGDTGIEPVTPAV
jgi:site-specific DNA recombinase